MIGVGGVLNRIQELRGDLGLTPITTDPSAGRPGTVTTGARPVDGSSFASVLAGASGSLPAGAGGPAGTGSASGDDVVAAAKKYLGTPYVFGSTDPDKGLDSVERYPAR